MQSEKTVGLSFRVTPEMKRKLEVAAAHQRRSLTNMFEVLVDNYCEMHGIGEGSSDDRKKMATKEKRNP